MSVLFYSYFMTVFILLLNTEVPTSVLEGLWFWPHSKKWYRNHLFPQITQWSDQMWLIIARRKSHLSSGDPCCFLTDAFYCASEHTNTAFPAQHRRGCIGVREMSFLPKIAVQASFQVCEHCHLWSFVGVTQCRSAVLCRRLVNYRWLQFINTQYTWEDEENLHFRHFCKSGRNV